ncbi:GNAT family N-acetyltransferase [Catenuloplanes sp. NPDC051500]|uniref:GNAT family N-acetyltransferase n=1 Tax=Catenuloplanes sp. NPDC051500 TaxID=3363959 RepID=UPI00379717E3
MSGWAPVTWSAEQTRDWWRRWTAAPEVSGAEFRVIAEHDDGSCIALWLVDTVPPVVLLGADGTAAMIASSREEWDGTSTRPPLASDFTDYAHQLSPAPAVRTATPDDAEAIHDLITTMGYDVPAASVRDRLRALTGPHVVFVAVAGHGRIVGWAHVLITHSLIAGTRAELGGLAVSAEKQGAGTALLTAAERWAARHGAAAMHVRSGSTRTGAHRFYEKRGYTVVKTQLALTKPVRS